jgi:hypothetical protein
MKTMKTEYTEYRIMIKPPNGKRFEMAGISGNLATARRRVEMWQRHSPGWTYRVDARDVVKQTGPWKEVKDAS